MSSLAGGEPSSVRQVEIPVTVPKQEVLIALGKYYQYDLTLRLAPGEQRVAVAVRDELSSIASYLARSIDVEPAAVAEAKASPRP